MSASPGQSSMASGVRQGEGVSGILALMNQPAVRPLMGVGVVFLREGRVFLAQRQGSLNPPRDRLTTRGGLDEQKSRWGMEMPRVWQWVRQ